MKEVNQAIENLIEALNNCEDYVTYRRQLDRINRQPELKAQIDAMRKENFEMQNETPEDQLMQRTEQFEQKYQSLMENPMVNDFLQAELAFVRTMREVNIRIMAGVSFEGVQIE